MLKVLRWTAVVLGSLIGLVVVAGTVLYVMGSRRLNRSYAIQVAPVAVPTDSQAIARGRHLVEAVALCQACHGEDLSGSVLVDQPLITRIAAPNLTAGQGGIGGTYSDADYVRAIRHGVNRDGRGLMIMHSDAYHHLSAADLGAIIGYVKSVPPVDNDIATTRGRVLGKVLLPLGVFDMGNMPLIAAETIDHRLPLEAAPSPGVNAEYGRYLVSIASCRMCHGEELAGGPPIEPDAPPGSSLIPYGAPTGWTAEQFVTTIRTGVTPDGKTIDGDVMPLEVFRNMTDDELLAIRSYVASLSGG